MQTCRARIGTMLTIAVAGVVGATASCGGADGGARPNVLLVSLDSTRRDLLSAYGRTPKHAPGERTSPNLDRIAEEGALFENASASSNWTLPSHVSILTGTSPLAHGVDLDGHRPSRELPMLAEVLKAHGYRTAGFFSGPYLEATYGFGRGFDRYEARYGEVLSRAAERWRASKEALDDDASASAMQSALDESYAALAALEDASHTDRSAPNVTDGVLDELELAAQDDAPFFVFAHYFDPHYDYVPPADDAERFDPAYDGTMDGRDFYTRPDVAYVDPERGEQRAIGERDLEHVLALYEAELAATDREIGRVLARLDALGLAEDTLVVVLADHGDEFFEHGWIGHRRTLFEEVLAVPLAMRLPGRIDANTRVPWTVSLDDVAPTIVELCGIAVPDACTGTSLVPLLDGTEAADRPALARFVGTFEAQERVDVGERTYDAPVTRVQVLETLRLGATKIERRLAWPIPEDGLPANLRAAVGARRDAALANPSLRWIDLAAHPAEPTASWESSASNDSSDARVANALRAFGARYDALSRSRRAPTLDDATEEKLAVLRGLGYVGGEGNVGAVPADELATPWDE